MDATYYTIVYRDSGNNDPLFDNRQFPTKADAIAYIHSEYANRKWNGPMIQLFRFNPASFSFNFVGEVSKG